jgi:hypothetical protein
MWMRVIALSGVIVLMLSAQTARPADSKTVTIRLISESTTGDVITDRAPVGLRSKGDVLRLNAELRNAVAQFGRPKGAIVGYETVIFTWLDRTNRADMTVKSVLPGGCLFGRAVLRVNSRMTYRISAGTGRFKNASGTGESVEIGLLGHRRQQLYRLVLG